MQDPHVKSIRYIAEPTGNTSYSNPPPLEYENDLCLLTLADGVLVVKPKDHYATVLQVREVIEQFLQAWEIDADLLWGVGTIRFTYQDHIVIDRNPLQSDNQSSQTLVVGAASSVWVTGSATLHVTRVDYPQPP